MEKLRTLKKVGNEQYLEEDFRAACVTYGKILSEMMSMERQHEALLGEEFNMLKSVIFSNLAAANLKLNDYEAVRRCCNASVVFLNEPDLPMLDLGLEERDGDNILSNAPLKEPIAENRRSSAAKVLYRRAYALNKMASTADSLQLVKHELSQAQSLEPNDKQIQDLIDEVSKRLNATITAHMEPSNDQSSQTRKSGVFSVKLNPGLEGMMINGGPCLKRQGHWSQTIDSTTVYLPLACFLCTYDELSECGTTICSINGSMTIAVRRDVDKAELVVSIGKDEVRVDVCGREGRESKSHSLPLEYFVDPQNSTWQLDNLYSLENLEDGSSKAAQLSKTSHEASLPPSHLVLHLSKVPSVEWFPGCEWWTAVFIGDEAIDTASCSVGTDARQLPNKAIQRAEQEHRRFLELGETERREELEAIMRLKRETVDAMEGDERALQAALAQDPDRGEMLGALSAEFPGVFFGSRR